MKGIVDEYIIGATNLYCFPFSYRSSNFAIEKVCLIFCIGFVEWFMASFLYCQRSLFQLLREQQLSLFYALKGVSERQKQIRVITLQGAIKQSLILQFQYWKNKELGSTIIISFFGGSNNIFADFRKQDRSVREIKSAKILLLPPKYKITIMASNHAFFQYCDSNAGLFSIAPCKVITLIPLCILFGISSLFLFLWLSY